MKLVYTEGDIEVFEADSESVATVQGGAAPWTVGHKFKKKEFRWYTKGVYICTQHFDKKYISFSVAQFKRTTKL